MKQTNTPSPTVISIQDGQWHINGSVTYPGTPSEGLLMNARMVNATFEDRNNPEFDSDANTQQFISKIPDYKAHGVLAFTFNLQGGMPGYEGAVNSAFNPDGSLRPGYMDRMKRVIDACDRNGCAVILGCFYQRQDQILAGEDAVKNGLANAIHWIQQQGCRHVLLEIANEFSHGGFNHRILKSPEGEVELIRLAKHLAPGLLVSTSGLGHGKMEQIICKEADFLLIHYNGTPVDQIPARIQALRKFNKPIVCNEDDKTGQEATRAIEASVQNGASWGYMNKEVNQYTPFEFNGPPDDLIVYKKLKQVTSR